MAGVTFGAGKPGSFEGWEALSIFRLGSLKPSGWEERFIFRLGSLKLQGWVEACVVFRLGSLKPQVAGKHVSCSGWEA